MSRQPHLSIVIPFHNERANAAPLLTELRDTVAAAGWDAEVVLVDDGSDDGTADVLDEIAAAWSVCRVIRLAGNRGQAAALWRGLHDALGTLIATMDGDGQNAPDDLRRLVPLLDRADLVVGVRANRHDTRVRRAMSRVANAVRARVLHDHSTDAGCALKVMRREVIASFLPIRTLYSFMPAMAAAAGWRVAETPVTHRPRTRGRSHYGLRAMAWRPLVDMLVLRRQLRRGRGLSDTVNPEAGGSKDPPLQHAGGSKDPPLQEAGGSTEPGLGDTAGRRDRHAGGAGQTTPVD